MFSFFACLSALAFLPIARVIARGQIPVIDNVIGGVPSHTAHPTLQVASTVAEANTPGKLRVVENSGVCGEFCCQLSLYTCLVPHSFVPF